MAKKAFNIYANLKGKDQASPAMLKGLGKIRVAAKGLTSVLGKGLGLGFGIAGANAILGGVKAAARGLKNLTLGYATTTDEAAKFSRQVGLTLPQLESWEYVAERQGVANGTLRQSFEYLNRSMGEIRSGAGRAFKFLESQRDFRPLLKNLKTAGSTNEAYRMTLDFLGRMPDANRRALLASKLFGGQGMRLLRIVEAGADGIAALEREAERYGLSSLKAGANAEAFKDSQAKLATAIGGVKKRIGETLMPVLTPYIEKMSEWVANNREMIADKVAAWIEGVAKSAESWLPRMGKVLSDLSPLIDTTTTAVNGLVWSLEQLNKIGGGMGAVMDFFGADLGGVANQQRIRYRAETSTRQRLLDTLPADELDRAQRAAQQGGSQPGAPGYWFAVSKHAAKGRAADREVGRTPSLLAVRPSETRLTVELKAAPGTSAKVTDTESTGPLRVFGDTGTPSHATGGGL